MYQYLLRREPLLNLRRLRNLLLLRQWLRRLRSLLCHLLLLWSSLLCHLLLLRQWLRRLQRLLYLRLLLLWHLLLLREWLRWRLHATRTARDSDLNALAACQACAITRLKARLLCLLRALQLLRRRLPCENCTTRVAGDRRRNAAAWRTRLQTDSNGIMLMQA